MKFKLINKELNDLYGKIPLKHIILKNRGIEDVEKYTNLDDSVIHPYSLLKNIDKAKECLLKHIEKESEIGIIVDSDVDGSTSAAILYQYLCNIYKKEKISYMLHTGKQHGIETSIEIHNKISLLFVPDAGSNDIEQCKKLSEAGIDIIVLDHHEIEKENEFAIVVNPFSCDYPNKDLSGCAVVKKFLECLDDELWNDSSEYNDLVALSIIADSMSIKSFENRRLIEIGLQNVENKLFQMLINKTSYSTGGNVTINNLAFYIVPLINALIRAGSFEEKIMMFKAFSQLDEWFDYQKNSKTEVVQEDIYTRVARIATNLKAKQKREIDKSLDELILKVIENNLLINKILICDASTVDWNYTGLVAMKLADKFGRPCLLVRRGADGKYSGSGRNNSNAIENLKDFLDSYGLFEYVLGHQNAMGISIKPSNLKLFVEKSNKDLENFDYSKIYLIDLEIDSSDIDADFVKDLNEMYEYYGQGIDESLVLIKGIKINSEDVQVMGEKKDTWKFIYNDEITFIKFRNTADDEMLSLLADAWGEDITLNIIGKCSVSEFGGILTPQVNIEDYEIIR